MRKVGIVMGSKSDLPTVEKAISVLKEYGIETEVRVLSATVVRMKQGNLRHLRAVADFLV